MRAVRRRSVPDPVDDELARPQLLERLHDRFRVPVVCVVAGAGFGKSTALAQAVRHNHVQPLGLDAWVTCRPGDEDAERLGHALLDQLGVEGPRGIATIGAWLDAVAAAVERAITDVSPLDLCLVLDDVHLVPAGSSAERLLVELVRRLPANGHLVLASRTPICLPLARLRAAGGVLDLGEADLAFSTAEVEALARSAGRAATDVASLGGWPALVRLGLAAPAGADRDFLIEEVLASLDDDRRLALLALALVGPADDTSVSLVVGRQVEVADVLRGVPLVARTPDGRHSAHQLWDEALRTSFPAQVLRTLQDRAIEHLLDLEQPARAAQIALDTGDMALLDRIAHAMVRANLNHIPIDTVRPWLRRIAERGPAIRLLDALVRYTIDSKDPSVGPAVDDVLRAARAAGDLDLETTALASAAVIAHAQQDFGALFPLAMRATEIAPNGDPVLDLLRAGIPAVGADLAGDPDTVITTVRDLPWARLPLEGTRLMGRLYLQALWMAGRAHESIAFADTWFRGGESYLGGLPALARWFAGDPTAAYRSGIGINRLDAANDRDTFVGSCMTTVIDATLGDRRALEAIWADGTIAGLAFDNGRDSAHLTYASAVRHVMAGDEALAAQVYDEHLARYPVTDQLAERHLRRFPAIGWVLSPVLREYWGSVLLGPDHVAACASAAALLAVRAGRRPGPLPPTPAVVSHLPLPWTVELVAGLVTLGDPRADEVWREVCGLVGPAAMDELARRAVPGRHHLHGAAELQARLPSTPASTSEILVLGPLEVRHGGVTSSAPELRRGRVRQLLEVLVLERTIARDRALALLWPDRAPDAAAKNLRVTLTHLRKVLEPDRPTGAPGFHLRVDQTSIALHASPQLRIDAWEVDELARRLDRACELATEREVLTTMVSHWRGVPYADLDDVVDVAGAVERVRQRQVESWLRLGELHIAAGAASEAKRLALEVLDIDPYREQAHRLAIAADLRLDDAAGVRRSVARLSEAMEELGVEVSATTRVLLHRVTMRQVEPVPVPSPPAGPGPADVAPLPAPTAMPWSTRRG